MPDFKQRSNKNELMDQEDISFEEFHDCLQGLEIINHLTLAYRPTLIWLHPWITAGEPLCILDAGCGGGDMLRQIARQLRRRNTASPAIKLLGVDLNPWSKQSAELNNSFPSIHYETADIFSFQPARSIDIIICSLFTHHLTDDQVVDFLRWIDARATKGWFINDLHRHPLPYYFIKTATAVFSRNRLIRHDAAVSVARAFSIADWRQLLARAGIGDRAHIQWFFPFRLCISCVKSPCLR